MKVVIPLLAAAIAISAPNEAGAAERPKLDISQACAQAPAKNKDLADPVRCLVTVAQASYTVCKLLYKLDLDRYNTEAEAQRLSGSDTPPKPLDSGCVREGLDTSQQAYKRALRAAGKNAAKATLLKDWYAAWRSAMSGIEPEFQESAFNYNRRQAQTGNALDEKAERLKLE